MFSNTRYGICLVFFMATFITACDNKNGNNDSNEPIEPKPRAAILKGEIGGTRTLSKDTIYTLEGFVYVVDGGILNIPAGTIIKGDKASMGTLIIERGAKIMAEGSAEEPIIFTSYLPKNARSSGDWGGIIICGKAKVNAIEPQVEGGPKSLYGGTDDADNSGILKYVRIEYPGFPIQPDKEINGLTLCGVGSGTIIDYIQVSFARDDSYEWFGGSVNCRHLIAFKGLDDDFDTDMGYSGKVQYALGVKDYRDSDISGSNGFESDNDAEASSQTPKTSCIFANVSLIGPADTINKTVSGDYKRGFHLRRNTELSVYNSVIAGWPVGLNISGTSKAWANALEGKLNVKYCAFVACKKRVEVDSLDTHNDYEIEGLMEISNTRFYSSADEVFIRNSFANIKTKDTITGKFSDKENANMNFLPDPESPLLSAANWTDALVSTGFIQEEFIGAFGTTDWTTGWTNWTPNSDSYTID